MAFQMSSSACFTETVPESTSTYVSSDAFTTVCPSTKNNVAVTAISITIVEAIAFFTAVAPEGVSVMTDINAYLDFVLTLFFAFGLAFEVPIATVLMVWAGFTTPARLGAHRPYVLLGAFVIGMLLTPPDVISQTLLAVPVYVLYEAGIIMSRIMVPGHKEVESQQNS